jgi:hypothetical protein
VIDSQSVKSTEVGLVLHAIVHPAGGFKVLPRRWVGERTIAWLNRCRRLCKDFENLTRNALAFFRLASIRLMLRKSVTLEELSGRTLNAWRRGRLRRRNTFWLT